MSHTDHKIIVLSKALPERNGKMRHPLHLCEPLDDKLDDLTSYLRRVGVNAISTTHLVSVCAGPEHPLFDQVIREYGLEVLVPCDPTIVARAIDMIAATGLVPTLAVNDSSLHTLIATAFTSESDWDKLANACSAAVLAWTVLVLDFPETYEEQDNSQRAAISTMCGALAVAMIQARAEWKPRGEDQ